VQSVPPAKRTTLVAVGDILLGRSLGTRMEKSGDYAQPFRNVALLLQQADIAFGNLEGPFCGQPPYPGEGMIFRVRPRAIESLAFAGFDVLSMANNHTGDGGNACLTFTLAHLEAAGIAAAGAGANYADAHVPAIVVRNGVRFAFLGYTYAERNDRPESRQPVVAGRNPASVRQDVAAALKVADAVIVSLHDGAEYTRRVARETSEFARAAIDSGAVLVLGHHPHVPQRVEMYKDGWIFYSLGNFVFQQYTPPETQHALLARITFAGARIERVEALPAVIEFHSRPRPATPAEAPRILKPVGLSRAGVYPPWPDGL
jgi:poly-gamma-glutamate synthesis protein (capsule biosynthesis protein)